MKLSDLLLSDDIEIEREAGQRGAARVVIYLSGTYEQRNFQAFAIRKKLLGRKAL